MSFNFDIVPYRQLSALPLLTKLRVVRGRRRRGRRPWRSGGRGRARKNSSNVRGVGISPIDMESQEVIKLERKRLRNRLAASKCRKRKLERISNLDEKVSDLKEENGELMGIVKRLKESICNLKQEVMEHVQHGCQINMAVSQGST